jgi:hypothetical protein
MKQGHPGPAPRLRAWVAACCAALALLGCEPAQRTAIAVAESDPADFSLSNTKPETFHFQVPADAKGPFDLALELTYFENQLQGWESLPVRYAVVGADGKEEFQKAELKLKDDKGEWRGKLSENMSDRAFEESLKEGMALSPGAYDFKLLGDNQDSTRQILGIVHLAFKVYSH